MSITLDCNDLEVQTAFWESALGYRAVERAAIQCVLAPADLEGPRLYLNLVPEHKSVKNRMHLDWEVDDIEAEATRLEALGAHRMHRDVAPGSEWITMQDPEGNEFCVCHDDGD